MSSGEDVFRQLQRQARSDAARNHLPTPTAEYLTRYALESFLDRLACTEHKDRFVLKGGILLAVYNIRRPTKDVDAAVVDTLLTAGHVTRIACDAATVDVQDGVRFDLETITVHEIRDAGRYPGLRVRIASHIGSQTIVVSWDISTGDPIVPPAQLVRIPRVLGGHIEMLGYAPEATIAEKGVTILERGISSTRWRDYIDIVQLAQHHTLDQEQLLRSVRAVARYRGVTLGPIAPVVEGYGAVAQAKWAAWRRKNHVQEVSDTNLDDQMARVAAVLDPVFARGMPT